LVALLLFFSAAGPMWAQEEATPVGEWLVLGSFSFDPEAGDPFAVAVSRDVLAAAPDDQDRTEGIRWTLHPVDTSGQLNFIGLGFLEQEDAWAYLLAYVKSETEQSVRLSVGSDDGIQVFVNGFEVHRNWALRGWSADQDVFPVRLGEGWNRLLLRVANHTGGFGGSARILAAAGDGPPTGVVVQARRPDGFRPAWTRAFLQVEEVTPSHALVAQGDDLALVLQVTLRNLGTQEAAGAQLRVLGPRGEAAGSHIAMGAGERRVISLPVAADGLAREVAAGSSYRLQLSWDGAEQPVKTGVELDPPAVLRIVTGDPPLRPELDGEDVEVLLDQWKWGEIFRPDLFDEGGRLFGDLLRAYLGAHRKEFAAKKKEIRRRVRDGGREVRRQKITFVGNSHIDMAWLWPRAETIEVVDMTYDQALKFMDEFPFFRYAQSQMQTYAWVEDRFPAMMKRLDAAVRKGKWIPVGGMWVEPDCNLPSGESLVRQLLYGKGYIRDRYGIDIRVGWNPDSFGYAWTLPMIFKGAGIDYFITQKIGWNDTTEFPHRLFWWESPDGSRLLTYFPFTYVDDARPDVLAERMVKQQEQQKGLDDLLNLYGVGDHGGGPTREMIGRYQEMAKIETFPEVEHAHPREFLEEMEEKHEGEIPTWNDELYLEYHRGTYTTQGEMKLRNRRMESVLETAEKLSALASALVPGTPYPDVELDGAWKRTLFNQFHDILPGSSIPEVYADARRDYEDAQFLVQAAEGEALAVLTAAVPDAGTGSSVVVFNLLSWPRTGIVSFPLSEIGPAHYFTDPEGRRVATQVTEDEVLVLAQDVPGIGYRTLSLGPLPGGAAEDQVEVGSQDGHTFLRNAAVWAKIDPATGALSSLVHRPSGREMLQTAGGNVLQLLGDTPSQWDAWNIGYTGEEWGVLSPAKIRVLEDGPLRAVVRAVRRIGNSTLTQDYVLEATSPLLEVRTHADWHEEHRFLKAAFHFKGDAEAATFEIPYGTIQRTTHPETEAEKARWEVSGHRWVDLTDRSGEFGLTLVDDSKYGYDVQGSTLRLSLLRSPKWPDPEADQGEHSFRYALYPHEGDWRQADSYRRGMEFNLPLRAVLKKSPSGGRLPPQSALLTTDADHVVLSAFKAVRDMEQRPRFAVRVHEVEGRAAEIAIRFPFPVARAWRSNLMEDLQEELTYEGDTVRLPVTPLQLTTVVVEPSFAEASEGKP
jgi:alpha-mannosidase